MVFSQLSQRNQEWGQAIVIPCKCSISSAHDLISEAKRLWRAEQSKASRQSKEWDQSKAQVSSDWGCVALLRNPKGQQLPKDWVDEWKKELSRQEQRRPYGGLRHAPEEEAIVDKAGMLKIDWPKPVAGTDLKELDKLDLLLATANEPCLEGTKYPSAKIIADAWTKPPTKDSTPVPKVRYFYENRNSGIYTFQDQSILDLLAASGLASKT